MLEVVDLIYGRSLSGERLTHLLLEDWEKLVVRQSMLEPSAVLVDRLSALLFSGDLALPYAAAVSLAGIGTKEVIAVLQQALDRDRTCAVMRF